MDVGEPTKFLTTAGGGRLCPWDGCCNWAWLQAVARYLATRSKRRVLRVACCYMRVAGALRAFWRAEGPGRGEAETAPYRGRAGGGYPHGRWRQT